MDSLVLSTPQVGVPTGGSKDILIGVALEEEKNSSRLPVPGECMKMDTSVANLEDLRSLLLTLRYWVSESRDADSILHCTIIM